MKIQYTKRKLGLRLIVWPLILILLFTTHMYFVVKRTWHFILYGGEFVNFEKPERENITHIFEMLKEIKENQKHIRS